jgi:Na+-driven multidrug efflux pump
MKMNTVNMTSGNPARHILNFTFPLTLTNMGQQLYMIVDGAMLCVFLPYFCYRKKLLR